MVIGLSLQFPHLRLQMIFILVFVLVCVFQIVCKEHGI
jgi:hypothetical protein